MSWKNGPKELKQFCKDKGFDIKGFLKIPNGHRGEWLAEKGGISIRYTPYKDKNLVARFRILSEYGHVDIAEYRFNTGKFKDKTFNYDDFDSSEYKGSVEDFKDFFVREDLNN